MKSAINTRFDRKIWWLLLTLVVVYVAFNLGLPRLQANIYLKGYIIPALLWGLIVLLVWRLPRYRPAGKTGARSSLVLMSLVLGVAQIIIYVLAGLFTGFGNSPSSFTFTGILLNLLITAANLAGMEFSRAWLLNHLGKRVFLSIIIISVIYAVLSLTLSQLTGMQANIATINFVGSSLLPELAESLLASLMALLAGPFGSIAYRGLLEAFWVFAPILPNLSWSLKGLIGVLVPILGMIITWNVYAATSLHGRLKRQSSGGFPTSWIVTAVVCVLIIWFAVGIFPVHPVMIATGSMMPYLDAGDIAIVSRPEKKDFSIGDIIEFRQNDEVNVVHRIIDITSTDAQKAYVTKGDANDAVDPGTVIPENVIGTVVFRVPKLGWVAFGIKKLMGQ